VHEVIDGSTVDCDGERRETRREWSAGRQQEEPGECAKG
jgi:hypothetical protein